MSKVRLLRSIGWSERVRIFFDGYVTGLAVGLAAVALVSYAFFRNAEGFGLKVALVAVLVADALVVAVRVSKAPVEMDNGVLLVRSYWTTARLPLVGPVELLDVLYLQRRVLLVRINGREARATTTTYADAIALALSLGLRSK